MANIQYGDKPWDKTWDKTNKNTPTKDVAAVPSPIAQVVADFHKHADIDIRRESIHHTLGPEETKASPGNHVHDGGTSRKILEGYILTGSKASPSSMWPPIIACLVRLGAKDSTTA